MKQKILLFLLFQLLGGSTLFASTKYIKTPNVNPSTRNYTLSDTIKKNKKTVKSSKSAKVTKFAIVLPPPTVTPGSTCTNGTSLNQVNLLAVGSTMTETIEWYTSQTATIPVYIGNFFSPNINTSTTYYVQSKKGTDVSIRVPVVASVYRKAPAVTMTTVPANDPAIPICEGTPVTFTAARGGNLFEFSVDGVVQQVMSSNRIFTSSTLTNGQMVRVRTRYETVLNGQIIDVAYGGNIEDNKESAALSANAAGAYINSVKISPTESDLIFGISGKLTANKSILLFLDTKTGGFSTSNYGDDTDTPALRGFNYFNNNPSTFDSYFLPDYCLSISSDASGTVFSADLIELKTGQSTRFPLGTAMHGAPSASFAVNSLNTGIADYNRGFEIAVPKLQLGYFTGDIKLFGFTMHDASETDYSVTNSFISPELTNTIDYGTAAVDYNLQDPNPVLIASSAMIPCYSDLNIVMSITPKPSSATTGPDQATCSLTSDPLEGNTPAFGTGSWSLKSGPTGATVTFSTPNDGSSTATVSQSGTYVFTWTISNGSCTPSTADIQVSYNDIGTPIVETITQPTCTTATGSVLISGLVGSWTITPSIGTAVTGTTGSYQFSNLAPDTTYTFTVSNTGGCTTITLQAVINPIPATPILPTTASIVQPTCAITVGTITISPQSGMEYSLDGITYQTSNVFNFLDPGNYTLYIRNAVDTACSTTSTIAVIINPIPATPDSPRLIGIIPISCTNPTATLGIVAQSNVEYSIDGTNYQASNIFSGLSAGFYSLYVRNSTDTTCDIASASTVEIEGAPTTPTTPVVESLVHPGCTVATGTITIVAQADMEYSLDGTNYQTSNVFSGLAPGNYTIYIQNTLDTSCQNTATTPVTLNNAPAPPAFPVVASSTQPTCAITSGTIVIAVQSGVEYSLDGTTFQTSNTFSNVVPDTYTLYVRNTTTPDCITASAATVTINAVPTPPLIPVAENTVQPTCSVPSGTIVVMAQTDAEYSLDGITFQSSNSFAGLSPGSYTLYVRNSLDQTCLTVSTIGETIEAIPSAPANPTTESIIQPTCILPSGTITISIQSGVEYSLDGTVYQASNVFTNLAPDTYSLFVRNTTDATCETLGTTDVLIQAAPSLPAVPTLAEINQPNCTTATGSVTITAQTNSEYSIGQAYQDSPEFTSLTPGNYTLSIRSKSSPECTSTGAPFTINTVPGQIQFEIKGDCDGTSYILTANPLASSYDPDTVSYQWKDQSGSVVGSNSNTLNVSEINNSNAPFPLQFSLTVTPDAGSCSATNTIVVESAFCNIQKGISPDGNAANSFFDLRNMNVRNLEVFDRYGIQVYHQSNYSDQWRGQSDKGESLPTATYYYVIQLESGESKTGWIYLIRGNN
jgi:gliding motility-associated-like protein